MESATFRAETVINEHRRLIVEEDVWEQVMAALERPPAPTQSMCKAFERYNSEKLDLRLIPGFQPFDLCAEYSMANFSCGVTHLDEF
jgi:hypothetical protein